MILPKNKILVIIFILLNFSFCLSQNIVKGNILDNEGKHISNANIILKPENGQNIVAYGYSDENGNYELRTSKTGTFMLSFSALNYEAIAIPVTLTSENKTLEQNITLVYKSIELNEVVIESNRPITIKNDSIVFDVKAFAQGNEEVVEDLLKKIPGLNVDSDGTIKVGNQEVEKVMVDYDDFFEKGYKVLTKNMPVSPIEKVELLQHYSNNKHLKGIENSNKVALNLVLKEDAKRQWFGNIKLGYGVVSENRYEVRSNLMNFGKKNKYYFLTNLNNIGEDATGDINNLIYSFSADPQIGDEERNHNLLSLDSYVPNIKAKRTNFNNAELLSLNGIFTLSKKVKLKSLVFLNKDENQFFKNSYQTFFANNTLFENTEFFQLNKDNLIGFGKLDLTYDVAKNMTLTITSKFNKTNEKDRSDLLFNDALLAERLQSKNQLLDNKVIFTNKLSDSQVFLVTGRAIQEKTPQEYGLNQFVYQDLFAQNATNINQWSENNMQFYGVEGYFLNRKNKGDLFELKIGNQYRTDQLNTVFQLKDDMGILAEPLGYQNQTHYATNDLYAFGKYHFKFKKWGFSTQIDAHQLFNSLTLFDEKNTQNPFFINPKVGFEWAINKKNKLFSSYAINRTNATLLNAYNGYIHTGFRSFSKATGAFNQLDASAAMFNYAYGSWGDKFFANTFVLYSKNHDFFSTNSIIVQNYSQSDQIIIKGREMLTFGSNFDRYFKPISSNLKIVFGGSKSNYKNVVNNSNLREVKNNSVNYGFELRSGFRGVFNYHIGSKWNYNEVKTTIKNSFTDNVSFIDLSLVFNKNINFQLQTERYYFGNLDSNSNKYYFMDLEGRYTVKENKLTFSVSGNNLFNTSVFRSYTISDISTSRTEYRLQPRYVLLKMEFRF